MQLSGSEGRQASRYLGDFAHDGQRRIDNNCDRANRDGDGVSERELELLI